ncbi:MAG: ribosome recycling factor [Clostridiales bacterium]|nr:ribosome recycling factor [Clostridiales bacterium]
MRAELKEFETKMTKSVAAYEKELATVRAGRANPAILDRVTVEYYGTPTPLNQVAQISLPDARTILVQPWDASLLKEAERAILGSDIGITPLNDGKALRLNFPQPTEERRRELCRQVEKMGESAKVAVRNVRREANNKCKELKKDGVLTEDTLKQAEKDVQDLTDKFTKQIDEITDHKKKEIMEI